MGRGFGFITYGDQEDAKKVLRMSHNLAGAHLNVVAAEERREGRPGNMNTNQPLDKIHHLVKTVEEINHSDRIVDTAAFNSNSHNNNNLYRKIQFLNSKICWSH